MIEDNSLKEGDLIYESCNNQLLLVVRKGAGGDKDLTAVRLNEGIYMARGDASLFEGIEHNRLVCNLAVGLQNIRDWYVKQIKEG